MSRTDYDTDFYAWALAQAEGLRAGRLADIDIEHIAEELETLGRAEKRELESRLIVLLVHLLKWVHQSERRGRSWRLTIQEQRQRVQHVLRDNPSLKAVQDEVLVDAYGIAVLRAAKQTGKDTVDFPPVCPWTLDRVLDDGFWPAADT